MQIVHDVMITCPECGAQHAETMPDDACRFFFTCPTCGNTLIPVGEDCCVFCSHGDVPCPPKQREQAKQCAIE